MAGRRPAIVAPLRPLERPCCSCSPVPPQHQFQSGAIWIRTWHPALLQFKMRSEAFHQFLLRAAEWRTVGVANHVMHGQKLAGGLQPPQHGFDVIIAPLWIDGAEKRVFEDPVELREWFVVEEIGHSK